MSCTVEYHSYVPRRLSNTVALFALLAAFSLTAQSQVNGVPASVTSPGFGGRAINGTPASVTSLGPRGFTPNSNPAGGFRFFTNVPPRNSNSDGHHHRRHDSNFFPALGVYPVPVAVPYAAEPDTDADDDSEEQGGPTIFDRRGRGEESYVPPVNHVRRAPREEVAAAEPGPELPEPAPEPTVLVFKDGRELEIGNYAIVGQTLFDLSAGHARRIALADLDLENTLKKNEDHGVSFQLPPGTQVN
jgi:hypothetical protein